MLLKLINFPLQPEVGLEAEGVEEDLDVVDLEVLPTPKINLSG